MSVWQILRPLITVALAEAVEARTETDGPASLADAVVGTPSLVAVAVTVRIVEIGVVVGTMTGNRGAGVTQSVRGVTTAAPGETSVAIAGGTRIVKTVAGISGRMVARTGTAPAIAMIAAARTMPSILRTPKHMMSRWLRWTSMRRPFRRRCVLSCVVSRLIPRTSLRDIWLPLLNFSTRIRLRLTPMLRRLVDAPRDYPSYVKWLPKPRIRRANMLLPSMTTARFDG